MDASMWTAIFSFISTCCIGSAAVYIAHKQAEIARKKFNADLFEKRLAIYYASTVFFELAASRRGDSDARIKFSTATIGAKWLFDLETANILSSAHQAAYEIEILENERVQMVGSGQPPTVKDLIDVVDKIRTKSNAVTVMQDNFNLHCSKFLRVD